MKIYRVHLYTGSDSSKGFEFFTSKTEAEKRLSQFKKEEGNNAVDSDITVYDKPVSKKGILDLLFLVASHPDNG